MNGFGSFCFGLVSIVFPFDGRLTAVWIWFSVVFGLLAWFCGLFRV